MPCKRRANYGKHTNAHVGEIGFTPPVAATVKAVAVVAAAAAAAMCCHRYPNMPGSRGRQNGGVNT